MEVGFGAAVVAAVALIALRPRWNLSITASPRPLQHVVPEGGPDLPCPWCQAPTSEDDETCPTCRQRFG